MRSAKLGSNGFTLMELLITSSIAIIAFVLMLMILVRNNNLLFNQSAKVAQGLGSNSTITEISDDLRTATAVVASYTNGATTYTTNATTLVLQIPSLDVSGNVIANTFDTIVVSQDPSSTSRLKKYLYPSVSSTRHAENTILLNNLSSVRFYYLDNNGNGTTPVSAQKVNFYVVANQKAGLKSEQSSASAEINLRNN